MFERFPVWEGIKTTLPVGDAMFNSLNVSLFEKGLRRVMIFLIFSGVRLNVSLFEKGLRHYMHSTATLFNAFERFPVWEGIKTNEKLGTFEHV